MKIFLIYISLFIISLSAYSQTDSLTYYLEIAAKNNPSVQQKFAEYQAALQKVPQVGSLPDPELNVGVFLSPMELVAGKQLADIRLMQMFPWFGVLKNARDEMSLMAKAKFESFRDIQLQVFFDLQQTWYELYKIRKAIQISEKNLEILRTLERLSLVKFKAATSGGANTASSGTMSAGAPQTTSSGGSGMNTMGGNSGNNTGTTAVQTPAPMQSSSGGSGLADLYRIQMETAELENSIALLRNQQNTIVARVNSFLNRPVQSVVSLPDTLKPNALNIPLLAVSDSMLTNNPMLGMLKFEEKSFEARKAMVTKMGYPMVGLGLNYSLIKKDISSMAAPDMNGSDMIMPMVTVTLPIYRKKYKAMQAEAELMKTATNQGIQAVSNSLQIDYYEAVQTYQDAERRMKLYAGQKQLANQSLNILMKSFSASGAGLTELLRVRQQTLDYGLKQVDAVADFNTAIARLNRLMAHSQIRKN